MLSRQGGAPDEWGVAILTASALISVEYGKYYQASVSFKTKQGFRYLCGFYIYAISEC